MATQNKQSGTSKPDLANMAAIYFIGKIYVKREAILILILLLQFGHRNALVQLLCPLRVCNVNEPKYNVIIIAFLPIYLYYGRFI